MNCYIHKEAQSIGTCVRCGKFICVECCTEIQDANYCKLCVDKLVSSQNREIEKLESKSASNQPTVFMNAGGGASSSSSASASSGSSGKPYPYPRQSIMIHLLLFCFTAGIGNIIYYLYIKDKQNKWGQF